MGIAYALVVAGNPVCDHELLAIPCTDADFNRVCCVHVFAQSLLDDMPERPKNASCLDRYFSDVLFLRTTQSLVAIGPVSELVQEYVPTLTMGVSGEEQGWRSR